jgi:formate hydrogenlyase subunit 6/NADH:ubiquinone oxidoreductase subunit I
MAAVKGFRLKVDDDACTGCGNCIVVCPVNAVDPEDVMGVDKGAVSVYDKEFCTGCGNCMEACAYNAIEVQAPIPVEIEKFQKVKDHLYGKNSEIYELIKEKGPLTITQIADDLGISVKDVSGHVFMLKTSDKVYEFDKICGKYTYSTEKAKKETAAAREEFRSKTSPEVAKEMKERFDAAIESFNKLEVRWRLVEPDIPEKFKGTHVYDAARCMGCGACARVCPNKCIELEVVKTPDKKKKVVKFDIDMSKCVFCRLCVDHCIGKGVLTMTSEYEPSESDIRTPIYEIDNLQEKKEEEEVGEAES